MKMPARYPLRQRAEDLNTLGNYLALREVENLSKEALRKETGGERVELMILFGGSLPHGCRIAGDAFRSGLCGSLLISGGEGHTTDHLRRQIGNRYPHIPVEGRMEAEIIADYLYAAMGIPRSQLLLETGSTNCGENVAFALELLKGRGELPRTALILQDSSMQRRMSATFEKVWSGERTRVISYASYRVQVVAQAGGLAFSGSPIWGMWSMERYIQLLLGEIPRLWDDENGYGPKGKGYLSHVEIPDQVLVAFQRLRSCYGELVRGPWKAL